MALTRNRLIGNLANATDSAASSSFLAKGATEANYQSIAYSDVTGKPTIFDSAGITSFIDSAYVLARQGSAVAGLDSAGITSLVDSNYVVARAAASGSGYGRYNYTATAGQTVFQDSDNSGAVLSYTSGGIMVFYNGVMLKNTTDWEGTDGSSVTLVEAADSGANVSIHKWTVPAGPAPAGLAWGGDRGIFFEGFTSSGLVNTTDYVDITTPGNATDFGDMIGTACQSSATASNSTRAVLQGGDTGAVGTGWNNSTRYVTVATTSSAAGFGFGWYTTYGRAGASDGTYGVFSGGYANLNGGTNTDNIEYITIDTTGNALNFGTLVSARRFIAGANDATYALTAGGYTTINTNNIQYFTIATTGNASDFGSITQSKFQPKGVSDETYGVFAGGDTGSPSNVIDYVTIATPGNATDFGDLTVAREKSTGNGSSNGTYGLFNGGSSTGVNYLNSIDYITIATPGNATDFGDMTIAAHNRAGSAGSPS